MSGPTSPIGFLFLKLPPPPCAVLLVHVIHSHMLDYNYNPLISVDQWGKSQPDLTVSSHVKH